MKKIRVALIAVLCLPVTAVSQSTCSGYNIQDAPVFWDPSNSAGHNPGGPSLMAFYADWQLYLR
jgi:hypothetical protein